MHRRGSDLRIQLTVGLEDVITGVNKKIKIKRYAGCQACGGNGALDGTALKVCDTCKGSGQEQRRTSHLFMNFLQTQPCRTCHGDMKTAPSAVGHACPMPSTTPNVK